MAELESRHGEPEILQAEFIQQLYECGLPSPGQILRVNGSGENVTVGCTGSSNSSSSSGTNSSGCGIRGPVVLKRPYDSRLEERDLTRLFNSLQVPIFLQVFSSLLLERKVLLLSKSISKLSACVDALQSILFPFVWQHTFIPVLPANMLDICQAPTPYIIGVLKGKHPILPPISIDHVSELCLFTFLPLHIYLKGAHLIYSFLLKYFRVLLLMWTTLLYFKVSKMKQLFFPLE